MDMYAERIEKNASEKDKTGIPHKMKAGFERSSGFSFNDVRVHYNSEKPAQLRAHAYTQGNEIYVAPGQEKHLPHELGHVVQQKSDVVRPTGEIGGLPLNDDMAMENDADTIAAKAQTETQLGSPPVQAKVTNGGVVQRDAELSDMDKSQMDYNYYAGQASGVSSILSTTFSAIGGIGAMAGFFYAKHNARKHQYIESVEKYSDIACDAYEDMLEARERYDSLNKAGAAEKTEAKGQLAKLAEKVRRNYLAAVSKAHAMGAYEKKGGFRKFISPVFEITPSNKKVDETKLDSDYDPKNIDDENIKNALERAKNAYNQSKSLNTFNDPPPSHANAQTQVPAPMLTAPETVADVPPETATEAPPRRRTPSPKTTKSTKPKRKKVNK